MAEKEQTVPTDENRIEGPIGMLSDGTLNIYPEGTTKAQILAMQPKPIIVDGDDDGYAILDIDDYDYLLAPWQDGPLLPARRP